jgi:hypothetical protein
MAAIENQRFSQKELMFKRDQKQRQSQHQVPKSKSPTKRQSEEPRDIQTNITQVESTIHKEKSEETNREGVGNS